MDETFSSENREYILPVSIMSKLMPEMYHAMRAESKSHATGFDLHPTFDIRRVYAFPWSEESFSFYHPTLKRDDDIFTARFDIVAARLDGARQDLADLASLQITEDGAHERLHVNPRQGLLVDPAVLYKVAEKYL